MKQDVLERMKDRNATYEEFIEIGRQDLYYAAHIGNYITFKEPELREFWSETLKLFEIADEKEYFSLDFVREWKDNIQWHLMFRQSQFDHRILFEFWDKVNWIDILYTHELSDEEIEFYFDKVLPDRHYEKAYLVPLLTHQDLSEEFIEKHFDFFKKYINQICEWQTLSEDFIEKYKDIIDWNIVSGHQYMSKKFMDKHENDINWNEVHKFRELDKHYVMNIYKEFMTNHTYRWMNKNNKLTESFIIRYYDRFKWDWNLILPVVTLSEEFIEEFGDEINDWNLIAESQNFDEHFVEEFLMKKKRFDIGTYLMHAPVSEAFIRKHWEKLDKKELSNLLLTQKLDESFMREFQDYIDMDACTYVGQRTFDFIREFKDKISFTHYFGQKLSEKQMEEFKDRLDWEWVSQRIPMSEKTILKYSERITWDHLERFQDLSQEFIEKYKDKIMVPDYDI